MTNIAIIGAGQGGKSILKALQGLPSLQVLGICDSSSNAPGMLLAKEKNVPTFTDITEIFSLAGLDLIIEATGSSKVQEIIETNKRKEVAVIDSHGANLMMMLVSARESMITELHEHSMGINQGLEEISAVIQELAASASQINTNEQHLNNNILDIFKLSQEINEILGLIKQIADETNMLGLNAAIEAARAGEQGRGFGVVAQEIRKLSDESKQTVVKIRDILNNITKTIDATVNNSQLTLRAIEEQAAATQEMGASIEEITNMAEQLEKLAQYEG